MSTKARKSQPGDWLAIEELYHRARHKLPRLWWWEEHLTEDSFILIERDGIVAGALFAWPDGSPVAWVRLAALDDGLRTSEWLNLALPPVLDSLRRRGTKQLAWMDYDGWVGPHLKARGFKQLTKVITLVKFDHTLPQTDTTNAYIRPVADADIPAVAIVDQAAFTPPWWHSESTLLRRAATASHFVVAETANQVVGYAEGDLRLPVAHLNRIAVQPAFQEHGVGGLLLNDALRTFWRLGAERVSLNTQIDNLNSQRLYRRFGFGPTGDSVTAWELSEFQRNKSPKQIL
ncbi:MAG: GNAT family N-acetyltransferase [Chloroflexi bacterium]|nr:GNAT family N-acetyltransferase [Chloroflexota bacterium]